VLLIGWDAADWELILPLVRAGRMPVLRGLIQRGLHGNLATLSPILSPLLWTSVATGKRADKHGILGFTEPDPVSGGIRPVCSTSRKCKAIWNILSQEGLRTHLVGWFVSHPAEPINGINVSSLYTVAPNPRCRRGPLPPGSVHPKPLEQTLADTRIYPTELLVEQMTAVLPLLEEIPKDDHRPGEVAVALAECLTIDRATTWILEHEDWDFLGVYYNAIDHLCHHFMPFHPPRREGIGPDEFRLYQGVVASIYCVLDQLLGRLLEHTDPDTAVLLVSDHGFFSDDRRPPPSKRTDLKNARLWHRPLGVICAAGPQFKQNEILHGASILDLTPTVLALFGLPIGQDMDGRPLWSALATAAEEVFIPSWETKPGDAGMHPPGYQEDPWEKHEALQQLADLGYIDLGTDDDEQALRNLRTERVFHLAVHYLETGRAGEAVPLFEELLREDPDNIHFRLYLARCRFMLGEHEACRQALTEVLKRSPDSPHAVFLLGNVGLSEGQYETALAHLHRAEQLDPRLPMLHATIGKVYGRLKNWALAEQAFLRALELDRDSAQADLGLAHVYLNLNRVEHAVSAARRALEVNYHLSEAHYVLGVAMARLHQVAPALRSFDQCLQINPHVASAHRWLATLHEQATGDQARAAEHRRRWLELSE
jgi:tetratricopeptide (TPR) repeat protein